MPDMTAWQRIEEQEEQAEQLMREFGLSYNAAMIHVLDCWNRAEVEEGGTAVQESSGTGSDV
jgi:hypothetical protein